MKFLPGWCCLVMIAVVLAGCSKPPVATTASSPTPAGLGNAPVTAATPTAAAADAVLTVIKAQTDALNKEDTAAYLATIDSSSPAFGQTKEMVAKLFEAYDLRYTVKEMKVESVNDDEAKVRFTQLTEKVAGPEFRNNQITGVHTLKKRDGQWKVSATEIGKLEYLDK